MRFAIPPPCPRLAIVGLVDCWSNRFSLRIDCSIEWLLGEVIVRLVDMSSTQPHTHADKPAYAIYFESYIYREHIYLNWRPLVESWGKVLCCQILDLGMDHFGGHSV